jgi:hypothetical protein
VDLSKPGCDDIEDDRPVSVRDTLVFLEVACFATPASVPTTPGGQFILQFGIGLLELNF